MGINRIDDVDGKSLEESYYSLSITVHYVANERERVASYNLDLSFDNLKSILGKAGIKIMVEKGEKSNGTKKD